MDNRALNVCTRAAVAIAASVAAVVAGGTVAASPASAAGSSSSPVIDVAQDSFVLILPDAQTGNAARIMAADSVTALHGFSTFKSIKIQSQGFDLEGTIQGTLRSHNFESLWQVYNLPKSAGWKVWSVSFKKDKSQSVLKETFRREELIDITINIKFKVSAAALKGVSTLRIGFETLRLELDGQNKDFTVINEESGGGRDQNGDEVPVDFEPV